MIDPSALPALADHGERFLPEGGDAILAYEHLHRYLWARHFARGKRVIDIASGEGYGAHILAGVARSVLGVDVFDAAVARANAKYGREGLRYQAGRCESFSREVEPAELVVSFETIEHLDDPEGFVRELAAALTPEGLAIISTPDRVSYTELTGFHNTFHLHELDLPEFEALLRRHFRHVLITGQKTVTTSVVTNLSSTGLLDFDGPAQALATSIAATSSLAIGEEKPSALRPLYLVALCSNAELPPAPASLSLLIDNDEALWRQLMGAETQKVSQLRAQMTSEREELGARLALEATRIDRLVAQASELAASNARFQEDAAHARLQAARAAGRHRVAQRAAHAALQRLSSEAARLAARPVPVGPTEHPGLKAMLRGAVLRRVHEAKSRAKQAAKALLRPPPPAPTPTPVAGEPPAGATPHWHLGYEIHARGAWPGPSLSLVLPVDERSEQALAEELAALRRQSASAVEYVCVSFARALAWNVDTPDEPWTWDAESGGLAATLLGKFVCVATPSLALVHATYLDENIVALQAHDADFTVNTFAPLEEAQSVLAQGRYPLISGPGHEDRGLSVFRTEFLAATQARFSASGLAPHGARTPPRVAGVLLRHAALPRQQELRFSSPSQWTPLEAPSRCAYAAAEQAIILHPAGAPPSGVRAPLAPIDAVLDGAPAADERPSVLVLMPFLAMGGAEHLTLDVLRELSARFRFIVATVEPLAGHLGSTEAAFREVTPFVYVMPNHCPNHLTASYVAHLIRRYDVEALFVPNGSAFFYDAAWSLRHTFPNLRIVNQVFDHEFGWINRYTSYVVQVVDQHLAPNRPILDAYRARHGVPESRSTLIYHGIDTDVYDPDLYPRAERSARRARVGLPDDKLVVAFMARIHPQKRPADFVRLAARFAEDAAFHFLMVGDGPLAVETDTLIAQMNVHNLTRLPFYSPFNELLSTIDLLVVTSEYEGLPLTVLEALSMGVPVISTKVGAIPEVIRPGDNGEIVDRIGDLGAFEKAVRAVAPRTREEASRAHWRADVIERFNIKSVARQYGDALLRSE